MTSEQVLCVVLLSALGAGTVCHAVFIGAFVGLFRKNASLASHVKRLHREFQSIEKEQQGLDDVGQYHLDALGEIIENCADRRKDYFRVIAFGLASVAATTWAFYEVYVSFLQLSYGLPANSL